MLSAIRMPLIVLQPVQGPSLNQFLSSPMPQKRHRAGFSLDLETTGYAGSVRHQDGRQRMDGSVLGRHPPLPDKIQRSISKQRRPKPTPLPPAW